MLNASLSLDRPRIIPQPEPTRTKVVEVNEANPTPEDSETSIDGPSRDQDVVSADAETSFFLTDDFWAIFLGMVLLLVAAGSVFVNQKELAREAVPEARTETVASADAEPAEQAQEPELHSALKPLIGKPGKWERNPLHSLGIGGGKSGTMLGIIGMYFLCSICFGLVAVVRKEPILQFLKAFQLLFLLTVLAYLLAGQTFVHYYGLSYALWALLVGLVISNTIGTPAALKPALRTELFIKTGLVILGAEILISKLLVLGIPGIFVAWVVTPIVLVTTFWFGQRILRIKSPSLNMVICADMCVCGVSAAIATAAACKAKKEELSAAIGLSLMFTAIMMVVMPLFVKAVGMNEVLGGAWIGGTIDATGAVALAGETLGDDAEKIATTVKMIQNILIGVIAFCVSIYWVRFQEGGKGSTVGAGEIWKRFPKFVLGFVAASLLFSWIYAAVPNGDVLATTTIKEVTKSYRGWFFCLAFVSIGLETNFVELSKQFEGGRPLVLYIAGQTLNLILTLAMAWLMFEKLFPEAVAQALK